MATALPAAADSFTEVPAGTKQGVAIGSRTHRQLHNDMGDAIEALTAMIGTGATDSSPVANSVRVGTGAGTAKWLAGLTAAYLADLAVTTGKIAANAITQSSIASGVTSSPTTTSGSPVDLTDMSVTLTTTGGDLLAICVSSMASSVTNAINGLNLRLDSGSDLFSMIFYSHASAGFVVPVVTIGRFTGVSAASHTVKARWSTNSGTLTAFGANRYLLVAELKK